MTKNNNAVNDYSTHLLTPTLKDFYCGACNSSSQSNNRFAILDSGATDHFLLPTAEIESKESNDQ